MKTCVLAISACLVLTFAVTVVTCQDKPAKTADEIKELIKQAQRDDGKTSDAAKNDLSNLTANSIPNLFEIVKKESPCTAFAAASVITNLNPTYPDLIPAIVKIIRGATESSLVHWEQDGLCRRYAAFLLPASAEGLKSILQLLKVGNTWERQAAIFALDDFTEVAAYNERPGEVEVMMEIVPALAKLQNSKDDVINQMSSEVLTQISGEPPTKLAELAKKLVKY